jgi:hypothetical protein
LARLWSISAIIVWRVLNPYFFHQDRTTRPSDTRERCVIVGPQKQGAINGLTISYSLNEKKAEIKVQHLGKTRSTGRNYKDFKGKNEVYWQDAILPEDTGKKSRSEALRQNI